MESWWGNIHLATYWRGAVNCYTADQLQMIQGLGTLFLLCLNPLEIFIVVCVHASICPVSSISIFSSFFQEIIHSESFSFFSRGEVGKPTFLSNS